MKETMNNTPSENEEIASNTEEKSAAERKMQAEEIIEAVLFAAGHAVPYAVIARLLEVSLAKAKRMVEEYAERYNSSELPRGVMCLTFDDSCQLCTKQQYLPYIRDALGIRHNGNLSNASTETLAVIAYNQPVTRSYVDTVRGVDSSYAVGSLLERGLIESKGRLDAPGRPMLYGTTPDFLRCFGLSSLSDLPGVSSEEAAEMLAQLNQKMAGSGQPDKNQVTFDEEIDEDIDEDGPRPDPTAIAIGETVNANGED